MSDLEKIAELKKQLTDLNREHVAITQLQAKLRQELNQLQKNRLAPLVGKFFKSKPKYFMVTDVPQVVSDLYGTHLNAHQIPVYAFYTDKSDGDYGEFGEEEIFSQCIDQDDVPAAFIAEGNTEITKEEFLAKAISVFNDVVNKEERE